ncbi:SAM-dependent methyltransferase [Actinomadura viridis]|uniref:SAM-dependent methyltransferase n=1 Tax=Actinomadura viridis TaxID=58110 RepID=UPI0036838800
MHDDTTPPPGVDTRTPSAARIYDYMIGGTDNYVVDRQAAESILKLAPATRDLGTYNRQFLQRVIGYMVTEAGIDQFIDIGSGLPTVDNVHQVAQRLNPAARVVYVDNDPTVLLHARALLNGSEQCAFLQADAREPDAILNTPETQRLIDLERPVGLLLAGVLHFIPPEDDPAGLVAAFTGALAAGSHVGISHASSEGAPQEVLDQIRLTYRNATAKLRLVPRDQIEKLFSGLRLVEPGVVEVQDWRPDTPRPSCELRVLGGVAVRD